MSQSWRRRRDREQRRQAAQTLRSRSAERLLWKWRRRELNPRPQSRKRRRLRAYPALCISLFTRLAGGVVNRQSAWNVPLFGADGPPRGEPASDSALIPAQAPGAKLI